MRGCGQPGGDEANLVTGGAPSQDGSGHPVNVGFVMPEPGEAQDEGNLEDEVEVEPKAGELVFPDAPPVDRSGCGGPFWWPAPSQVRPVHDIFCQPMQEGVTKSSSIPAALLALEVHGAVYYSLFTLVEAEEALGCGHNGFGNFSACQAIKSLSE